MQYLPKKSREIDERGEGVKLVIGTSCAVLWTRRSQSSFISLVVWLAVPAYSLTYSTTRNSLKFVEFMCATVPL